MSSEIVPSTLGISRSDESPDGLPDSGATTPKASTPAAPNPTGPGTASADDLGLSPDHLCPDPLLDEFKPEPTEASALASPDPEASGASAPSPAEASMPPAPSPPGSWSQVALDLGVTSGAESVSGADPTTGPPAFVEASESKPATRFAAPADPVGPSVEKQSASRSTADSFAAIDLSSPPASTKAEAIPARAKVAKGAKFAKDDAEDEEEDEGPAPRGSSWPFALLASYASAVTIGLIWVLWGNRVPRESAEPDPFPPADNAPDPGHRADLSRKLVPPTPLPPERIAALGQTLRFGSLEVTPLEVSVGPVILRHAIKKGETRRAGEGALSLRLRLKNIPGESILVPLDEAFLRERGRGIHDSFIETGPTRQIDMFPLAVVSEWSIVGQEFRELRPGESYETLVVSAPNASDRLAPDEMTWRIRVRTDINQTETLGVHFRANDIVRRPGMPQSKRNEPGTETESQDNL
jgi:hypothetical protein